MPNISLSVSMGIFYYYYTSYNCNRITFFFLAIVAKKVYPHTKPKIPRLFLRNPTNMQVMEINKICWVREGIHDLITCAYVSG